MFDGTLGDWYTDTVDLELKPNSKYFNCKYYTVPRINKETFRKEIQRLAKIGMLTPVQQYQYGTPVVMIQNKERTTRFINDYQSINHQLVRKSHPLPIIDKKIQQLEIFQYATALDLNMGYYTINILTASQDMTTIVTEFGKFIYNSLPMGM